MVFPNPGTGIFRIETQISGNHFIEIFDAIGQKVMQKYFGEDFVNVDLSNYLPGFITSGLIILQAEKLF